MENTSFFGKWYREKTNTTACKKGARTPGRVCGRGRGPVSPERGPLADEGELLLRLILQCDALGGARGRRDGGMGTQMPMGRGDTVGLFGMESCTLGVVESNPRPLAHRFFNASLEGKPGVGVRGKKNPTLKFEGCPPRN